MKPFVFAAQHMSPMLALVTHPKTLKSITSHHCTHNTPLYQQVHSCTRPYDTQSSAQTSFYPCTPLNVINMWTTVSALARQPYHTPTAPWSQWNNPITPASHILIYVPDTSTEYHSTVTSHRWILRATPLPQPHAPPVAFARLQTTNWFLYASP